MNLGSQATKISLFQYSYYLRELYFHVSQSKKGGTTSLSGFQSKYCKIQNNLLTCVSQVCIRPISKQKQLRLISPVNQNLDTHSIFELSQDTHYSSQTTYSPSTILRVHKCPLILHPNHSIPHQPTQSKAPAPESYNSSRSHKD